MQPMLLHRKHIDTTESIDFMQCSQKKCFIFFSSFPFDRRQEEPQCSESLDDFSYFSICRIVHPRFDTSIAHIANHIPCFLFVLYFFSYFSRKQYLIYCVSGARICNKITISMNTLHRTHDIFTMGWNFL